METKELRVGNLVIWIREGEDVDNEIVSIYNITRSYVRASTRIEELSEMQLYYEDLQPIPITHEWLVRLGFDKDKESWYYSLDFNITQETFKLFELTVNNNPLGLYQVLGCNSCLPKTEYVHQLQNLYFALTGEELEIKEDEIKAI